MKKILLTILAMFLLGCSNQNPVPVESAESPLPPTSSSIIMSASTLLTIPVDSVSLSEDNVQLEVGEWITLIANVLPVDATDKSLSWQSSNDSIASVKDGVVTAEGGGIAVITATALNGKKATCEVTVIASAMYISLNKKTLSLGVGETATLRATITPPDTTDKTVTWSSSNPSVASVNNGVVRANMGGTAQITAKTSNGKTATCKVTVLVPPSSISLNMNSANLEVGDSIRLQANILPSDASDKSVTWNSSDSSVARVNGGVVVGLAGGTAVITATTSNGLSARCNVTVKSMDVTSIVLNKSVVNLEVGESETLVATILPADASKASVTWSSSNPSVVSVNNGVVTAMALGDATITVSAPNGLSAKCRVYVIVPFSAATLGPSSLLINVGDSYTYNLIDCYPFNATEKVVLQTTRSDLIDIGDRGVITAKGVGEAKVFIETKKGIYSESLIKILDIQKVDDMTLNNWSNPAYFVTETAEITDIHLSFGANSSTTDTIQKFNYTMKLKKTYCVSSGSNQFKINWKLYDPNDVVVDRGTLTSVSFAVGETTILSGSEYIDWSAYFGAGVYKMVFSEVAW